jgi:hypothetical protein
MGTPVMGTPVMGTPVMGRDGRDGDVGVTGT